MDQIRFAYGRDVNLYKDVLRVSPGATDNDIQSAFVARRYELFNELQSAAASKEKRSLINAAGVTIQMTERQFTEQKMDALIASYRLLSDGDKRRRYNMSVSLAAANERKRLSMSMASTNSSDSPVAVPDLEINESRDSHTFDVDGRVFDQKVDDSREHAQPLTNIHKGPSPTKESSSHMRRTKKKLTFESPESKGSVDSQDERIVTKSRSRDSHDERVVRQNRSRDGPDERIVTKSRPRNGRHSQLDISSSQDDDSATDSQEISLEEDDDDDADAEYELERLTRERAKKHQHRSVQNSSSFETGSADEISPNRMGPKVRWTKSAETNASK